MLIRFIRRAVLLPVVAVTKLQDAILSPRGILLGFLAAAAIFAWGTWLRPTLSPDIRGLQLPLNAWGQNEVPVTEMMTGPRNFRWDSIGVLLLAVIIPSILVVLFRRRWVVFCLGLLLAVSMMCVSASVVNSPELIALMDLEELQRIHISSILHRESDMALSGTSPPRTTTVRWRMREVMRKTEELTSGDLMRGWHYTIYGPWLVFATMFAMLGYTRGTWDRRLGILGIWTMVGVALSGAACSRRLVAEYHWNEAHRLERLGDLTGARREVARCATVLPEMARIEDVVLLVGKIDYRQKHDSTQELMFRAYQRIEHGDLPQALALAQEMVRDYRIEELPLAVRNLCSRIYVEGAMQNLNAHILAGAVDKYETAILLAPHRIDCPIGLATVATHSDENHPERIRDLLEPLLLRVGDRLLRADLYERLGFAYFQAGDFDQSRHHYQAALDEFNLPKAANIPAQEGMLGL